MPSRLRLAVLAAALLTTPAPAAASSASIKVALDDVSVIEGDLATNLTSVRIPVTLSEPAPETMTVTVAAADRETSPNDYVLLTGARFQQGDTTSFVTLWPTGDERLELEETLLVYVTGAVDRSGAALDVLDLAIYTDTTADEIKHTAIVTIEDDDLPGDECDSLGALRRTEGEDNGSYLLFDGSHKTGQAWRIDGDGRAVYIRGTDQPDAWRVSNASSVRVYAEDGDDHLVVTDGAKVVFDGGDGNDTACTAGGDDVVDLGPGEDWYDVGAGDDTVTDTDGPSVVLAGKGDDEIDLGGAHDRAIVRAGDGDDSVVTGGGDDVVDLGDGDDHGSTHDGDDRVGGGSGHDSIWTADGWDIVRAAAGDDSVVGGDGGGVLDGGAGSDFVAGGAEADLITDPRGVDRLEGWAGYDTIADDDAGGLGYFGLGHLRGGTDRARCIFPGLQTRYWVRDCDTDTGVWR